jgi:hypothetical protein
MDWIPPYVMSSFFVFIVLGDSLAMKPRLTWTCDPPASASQVLGSQLHTTTPDHIMSLSGDPNLNFLEGNIFSLSSVLL